MMPRWGWNPFVWLVRFWHARQRAIDVDILWPACRDQAIDLDHARAAFALHASHDPAWLELGEETIGAYIGTLE